MGNEKSFSCNTCKCNDIMKRACQENNKNKIYCKMVEKYIIKDSCYGGSCSVKRDENSGYCK